MGRHRSKPLRLFADTARVHDEKQDYVGRSAIRDWIDSTTRKYRFTERDRDRSPGRCNDRDGLGGGKLSGQSVELRYRFE